MDEKNIVKQILIEIEKHKNIIILRHVIPDGDAYGSQWGLKKLIELNWPEKNVKISGKTNHKLDYLGVQLDNISDEEFKNSLVIVTDTANKERIDEPRWKLGKKVIKIDHHPNREPYGDIILVKDDYCSCCEIIGELIMENNLKINQEIAKVLYHGIVTDSMRFLLRFPKPRTFRVAAFLLEQGFDLQELYQVMYQKNEKDLSFISYIYKNYQKTKNGVAYLMVDYETLKLMEFDNDSAAYDNISLLGNIEGILIWAFFFETKDKIIRAELRTNKLTINHIAEKHNGGGHKTSCGTIINNFNEAKVIINELDKIALNNNKI